MIRGPLARQPQRPIEDVCAGCNLRHTKPGNLPADLGRFIGRALELDELHAVGARFAYPEALRPEEWAALQALERGRRRDESKKARAAKYEADKRRVEGLIQHKR